MRRFPLAYFWIYYVSCACVVESCACQLYIKRIYDDDDDIKILCIGLPMIMWSAEKPQFAAMT